jgi:Ca2+-binding RTX toxin-like protein
MVFRSLKILEARNFIGHAGLPERGQLSGVLLMTDLTVLSGDIRNFATTINGDGGKITIQEDGYIINAAGAGVTLNSTGPLKWDVKIDGGIQSAGGFGIKLNSIGGAATSNINVGINGTVFGGGSAGNGSAISSSSSLNIKNEGAIWSLNSSAILISPASNFTFKIVNTETGYIQGGVGQSSIVTGFSSTSNNSLMNAGKINGVVSLLSGNNTVKNSGSMTDLLTGSGNDTVTNTQSIGDVTLSDGDNQFTNSRFSERYFGGIDKDTIKNSGIMHDVSLGAGLNIIKNAKSGVIDNVLATNMLAVVSSNSIENAGQIDAIDLSTTSGNNIFKNSGYTANYFGGSGADVVINNGEIDSIVVLGAGDDSFTGGKFKDAVSDGAGKDVIKLGAEDDIYYAVGGVDGLADFVDGGAGLKDLYDAGTFAGSMRINLDTVDHRDDFSSTTLSKNLSVMATGNDTIQNFEFVRSGNGNDVVFGNGADNNIRGNSGTDTLYGLGGKDIINGGNDADKIIGGAGADDLTGGSGADQFIFSSLSDSGKTSATRDVITDFAAGIDDIVLDGIDANSLVAGVQDFTFLAGTNADFTGVAGQLRFLQLSAPGTGGITLIQGDVNGDQIADFSIELHGHVALTAGDFLL